MWGGERSKAVVVMVLRKERCCRSACGRPAPLICPFVISTALVLHTCTVLAALRLACSRPPSLAHAGLGSLPRHHLVLGRLLRLGRRGAPRPARRGRISRAAAAAFRHRPPPISRQVARAALESLGCVHSCVLSSPTLLTRLCVLSVCPVRQAWSRKVVLPR